MRICRDLISPIGAIGNGVELLSLTDGDTGFEMELIDASVQNASARIRHFRIAFGAASKEQTVRRSDILSILSANARGGRFNYV
ncbi:MAG: histidine phosphotransferase ChpT [Yoonia sp.]